MTFETEDRAALRESVRSLLAKHSDSAAVRKAINSPDGYDPDLWSRLVEQVGVAALAIPEEYDGSVRRGPKLMSCSKNSVAR